MKVDGVFSGGGVKSLAFIGALEVAEEQGIRFERTAGTSAGAIMAALLAAGYSTKEIKHLFLDLDMGYFLQEPTGIGRALPFLKWLTLYFSLGLYKGNRLEAWMKEKLLAKGIYRFSDLKPNTLKIVASDLSLGKIVVFPDDLERLYNLDGNHYSIARAVRISASIPFFFRPVKFLGQTKRKNVLVDGGLLSNFPIWLFKDGEKKKRPILGMKISSLYDRIPAREVNGAIDMFYALFTTMMQAHDARYISKTTSDQIMFINTEEIEATDFHIDLETKKRLIDIGQRSAEKYLKRWTY
ncbi:NTE family protein [Salirhabdus euzebyi]|uniref:NTE family protein n=1 Tax=Salirhabdus euzebyi TaxID=394506 RepID=A0A841Q752_9BACI|nr:patatin-like phospholipase family protein [Salirhabdus euzebyi]MBB6454240.1 NTE family protein [Salirhabdus euzebyi]